MFKRKNKELQALELPQTPQEQSKARSKEKRYFFRRVVKEIKRVRWPNSTQNWKNLIKIIIFTAIFVLFVYLVSIACQQLWGYLNIT